MSLGIAFRQIVESMPEDKQKEYKDKIMTNVVKQFSEVTKKQEHDVLHNIGDLIDRLYQQVNDTEDDAINESPNNLLLEAATTIDILAERIIDSENTSALRVYELEQKLLTKQAYIDYLKSRLDDSSVGYVKMRKEYLDNRDNDSLSLKVSLSLAESLRKSKLEFKEKYGELLDSYSEEHADRILEIYQYVITENATILKETDGQFTGGVYDIVYQLDNVEIDLGKTETRTYFFTMEWSTSMKEPLFYSLEVYAKPN